MRIVLDTNILIAAFVSRGACSDLLEHCSRVHSLVASMPILKEFHRVLIDKIGIDVELADADLELLSSRVQIVEPVSLGESVSRDPDDDLVLATAISGSCECIITGDRDLLDLGRYREIDILRPADFWIRE
ncbi:MAG: putative toxin-antitoxin system toxin component, PIN family [Gemmatimonadetes bacterium]|nr:putative toxin-antitoxin system toxin component, PIN family [Gemmatimonadota bacterium]